MTLLCESVNFLTYVTDVSRTLFLTAFTAKDAAVHIPWKIFHLQPQQKNHSVYVYYLFDLISLILSSEE